jgi:hypothetical protein
MIHCFMKSRYRSIILLIFLVSPCDSVTCQNEGTCVVEAGLAVCYCKGDYSGSTCSGNVLGNLIL